MGSLLLVGFPHVTTSCGRFEGMGEYTPHTVSGGEPAAMVVVDVCDRLLPGVVNNSGSITEESFSYSGGVLEYPQYTRPKQWRKHRVPKILLSGNHKKISDWRQKQSQVITKRRRPELLDGEINDKFT